MKKSQPISIRFNEDDLKICLLQSKKKTKQELVDWFCKNYADLYRVKEDNPFEKKQVSIDLPKNEPQTYKEPPQFNIPPEPFKIKRSMSYFIAEMKNLDKDDITSILQLKRQAEESTEITTRERLSILLSLQNGTY
jgi:hypothetical protein